MQTKPKLYTQYTDLDFGTKLQSYKYKSLKSFHTQHQQKTTPKTQTKTTTWVHKSDKAKPYCPIGSSDLGHCHCRDLSPKGYQNRRHSLTVTARHYLPYSGQRIPTAVCLPRTPWRWDGHQIYHHPTLSCLPQDRCLFKAVHVSFCNIYLLQSKTESRGLTDHHGHSQLVTVGYSHGLPTTW